ncbi:MAG: hypothetical protein M3Q89_06415 [Verrucomicrobiota bacterium]|nr:hypothetical protein [Verrucomicrobiota bacterium]
MLGLFLLSLITAVADDVPLKTIEDRMAEYGEVVRQRLEPKFRAARISYPPPRVTLLGFKQERVLEVYAAEATGESRFVCSYPILAASGVPGPKLREGDRQVPEGVYCVRELNPNSKFHLSLWIDYPNTFDLARAAEEGRTDPGGEIMIHGDAVSRGCLAVGDPAAEDLFVLAALTGFENITVVLAPFDFRDRSSDPLPAGAPAWTTSVYEEIKTELAHYTPDPESHPSPSATAVARDSGK